MPNQLCHKEAMVKREITRIYKEALGKGPESTEIKIYQNFLFMKFIGAFTQVEESLLFTEKGKELVAKIRDELILQQRELYVPDLERIIEDKVEKINYLMDEKKNTIYLFIMFANEIQP